MKAKKNSIGSTKPTVPIRVYVDGAGARPDGKGSGFAWIQENTGKRHIHREDGLTNNEAEYLGLRSALEDLPVGSNAEVSTDSTLVCGQFNGQYRVRDAKMSRLLDAVKQVIANKQLTVKVVWIPRQENLAGKLL
jgi:ribonuclease HI